MNADYALRQLARVAFAVALVAASCLSSACYNDTDTLYAETHGQNLDEFKIVIGWFPMHPDLYYRMRIKRCASEIVRDPSHLELYDDIAVAYGRLGDDPSAIQYIEQKRDYMVAQGIKPHVVVVNALANPSREEIVESSKDPWYRYYANAGTFWVHRWFSAGMPSNKTAWLDEAQKDIDTAIKLNPYAHGLREFAQDDVIRWLRTTPKVETLSDFLTDNNFWIHPDADLALAGLIELGGAWESVDVYDALANSPHLAGPPGQDHFRYLIIERVDELQRIGTRSRTGSMLSETFTSPTMQDDQRDYVKLRNAADGYRAGLREYELARLRVGLHPDTDPAFYYNYHEPSLPSYGKASLWLPSAALLYGASVVIILLFVITIWLFVRFMMRRVPSKRQ